MMASFPSLQSQHHNFNLTMANQAGRCWSLLLFCLISLVPDPWYPWYVTSTGSYRKTHHLSTRCLSIPWPWHLNQSEWLWINILFSLPVNLIGYFYNHVSHIFNSCSQIIYLFNNFSLVPLFLLLPTLVFLLAYGILGTRSGLSLS